MCSSEMLGVSSNTFSGISINGLSPPLLKAKISVSVHYNVTVVLNIGLRNEIFLGFRMTSGGKSPRMNMSCANSFEFDPIQQIFIELWS